MNLPVNGIIVKNVNLTELIPEKLFQDLLEKAFSGFSHITIDSKSSFEESIIIFSKGKIVGSIYLIDYYNVELFGKSAINLCFSSFGSQSGILNLYSLSEDQIKLILIFNDKIAYNYNIDKKIISKINFKYNGSEITNLLKDKIIDNDAKKDIFTRLGLSELLKV
ncbi:MAG: DUF2226 domain-containing protein [archaeon]